MSFDQTNLAAAHARILRDIKQKAEAAIREVAQEAANESRALAPRRTGRLASSIQSEAEGLNANVFSTCEYARDVELGTSRQAPHPFMGPVANRLRYQLAARLAERMRQG